MSRPDASALAAALPELARVKLLDGPTPLQPMHRLASHLGGRAELWIKREDLGPLAFSGNKLRNLEFLLGAALAEGADTIVTSGRRWSNHCRLTAAAGARLGVEVHVVVSGPPVADSANIRLMQELGATVHEAGTDDRDERERLVGDAVAQAEAAGHRACVLPVGGSEPAGAWGQVLAGLEAIAQARAAGFEPDAIVLATATGGTQAGLIVGAAIAAPAARVLGFAVHPDPDLRGKITRLVAALGEIARLEPPSADIALDDSQIGPGYGVPSEASAAAAGLLATTEGLAIDPVYGAKGLAGLLEDVRDGAFDRRRVVFWHGGGLPALFEAALGR